MLSWKVGVMKKIDSKIRDSGQWFEKIREGTGGEIIDNLEGIPSSVSKKKFLKFIGKKSFGVRDRMLWTDIYYSASCALPMQKEEDYLENRERVIRSVYEEAPQDSIETKLVAQEAVLYEAALSYLGKASSVLHSGSHTQHLWHETYMKNAIKLLKLHNQTIEVLSKHRRGGKQQVLVQHQYVKVEEGGKAVVGNFQSRGGGNAKR